jgi:hypothetical protein
VGILKGMTKDMDKDMDICGNGHGYGHVNKGNVQKGINMDLVPEHEHKNLNH